MLDGQAQYFFTRGQGKRFFIEDKQLSFAEESLMLLKQRRPSTITEGLVRVNVMQRNDGVMIVNEFESLEADYHSDTKVSAYLFNFWELLNYKNLRKTSKLRILGI